PNAQTHLSSVWHLLAQPPIQAAFPWLAEDCARSAMLLGAISPDARVVSGHPRTATHSFDIPMQEPRRRALFRQWPALADAAVGGSGREAGAVRRGAGACRRAPELTAVQPADDLPRIARRRAPASAGGGSAGARGAARLAALRLRPSPRPVARARPRHQSHR